MSNCERFIDLKFHATGLFVCAIEISNHPKIIPLGPPPS